MKEIMKELWESIPLPFKLFALGSIAVSITVYALIVYVLFEGASWISRN